MKETGRIIRLFEKNYNGEPWIDVNLANTLKKLTPKQASKKLSPKMNSIWEIVNHLTKWRIHILRRLQGEQLYVKADNYFEKVTDTSLKAWKQALGELDRSQKEWIDFLKKFKDKDLDKVNPNNGMTYWEHLHIIIQHDAYHLGQIMLLRKMLK